MLSNRLTKSKQKIQPFITGRAICFVPHPARTNTALNATKTITSNRRIQASLNPGRHGKRGFGSSIPNNTLYFLPLCDFQAKDFQSL
jgi:hypothetical protein